MTGPGPASRRRTLVSLAAACAGFVLMTTVVGPAAGRLGVLGVFDAPRVSEAELATLRGGFSIGGVELSFGAQVRTVVDGRVALETRLVPNGNGEWNRIGGTGPQGLIDAAGSPISPTVLPARLAAAVAGGSGIVIDDDRGLTAVLHQLPSGAPGSLIVNEAAGRTITQDIQVNIGVENYRALTESITRARIVRGVP